MRPSSWNGVGAIAKVPAALWVSFVMGASVFFRHSGAMRSIEPGISRFRVHASRAPERQSFKSPRRFLDLFLGEEDFLGVGNDILGLPSREWRRPAFHFHHPHLAHAARA